MSLEEMLAELRKDYLASMPEKIQGISAHWAAGQIPELQNDFHKLKGTGKTYGLPEVTDLGRIMEKLCKTSPERLQSAMPLAQKALQKIYDLRQQNNEVTDTNVIELTALRKLE